MKEVTILDHLVMEKCGNNFGSSNQERGEGGPHDERTKFNCFYCRKFEYKVVDCIFKPINWKNDKLK